MIETGNRMDTSFTLNVVQNGEEKEVPFSELLDRPAIVSVYMRNNTGGCDKQNSSLAEHASWFDEKGYNLVAISKDSCGSHKKYAEKMNIHYTLASDPEYAFSKATDSIVEKKMYGKTYMGVVRSTYIINPVGEIAYVYANVKVPGHVDSVIEKLKELQA